MPCPSPCLHTVLRQVGHQAFSAPCNLWIRTNKTSTACVMHTARFLLGQIFSIPAAAAAPTHPKTLPQSCLHAQLPAMQPACSGRLKGALIPVQLLPRVKSCLHPSSVMPSSYPSTCTGLWQPLCRCMAPHWWLAACKCLKALQVQRTSCCWLAVPCCTWQLRTPDTAELQPPATALTSSLQSHARPVLHSSKPPGILHRAATARLAAAATY